MIDLEGCHANCASRMMRGVIEGLIPEIVAIDRLHDFDRRLFGSDEMPAEEILGHARAVAQKVAEIL